MKFIIILFIIIFSIIKSNAQKRIIIDSNTNENELINSSVYKHFEKYKKSNFFYIGFPQFSPNSKGLLFKLSKKGKIKNVLLIKDTLKV
jgi:hypothetical protein